MAGVIVRMFPIAVMHTHLPLLRHPLQFKNFVSLFLLSIPPSLKIFRTVFPTRMFPLAVMHRGAGTLYELSCISMEDTPLHQFKKGFKI